MKSVKTKRQSFKVADLFSGAGGLTLGFQYKIRNNSFVPNEDFDVIFANEYDEMAAEAFKCNFPDIEMIHEDIVDVTSEMLNSKGIDVSGIDLVIGGPPCQSYSTIGGRNYDDRAKMYEEYIRMLGILKPKMFIFENVTGLLSMKNDEGNPVLDDIKRMFVAIDAGLSYKIEIETLNARDYGVPQSRERVFIVGIKEGLSIDAFSFPAAKITGDKYLTIEDAISDLPKLAMGEEKTVYQVAPKTDYQRLMRGNNEILREHKSGTHGDKMQMVIKNVKPGEGRNDFNRLIDSGKIDRKYYLTSGYANTYGRLWWDRPSTTLTNSFGTPSTLRCIHPIEDRALTTREGARLQSFPDWVEFYGNKYEKNSQVGNAVPPLLAIAIAEEAAKCLRKLEA